MDHTSYHMRMTSAFKAIQEDDDTEWAVTLLKELTPDQRTEALVTLEMFGDVVYRAQRECGDL